MAVDEDLAYETRRDDRLAGICRHCGHKRCLCLAEPFMRAMVEAGEYVDDPHEPRELLFDDMEVEII